MPALWRLTMSSRIKQALVNDEFELFYSLLSIAKQRSYVVLRLYCDGKTRKLGMVAPGQFIPLAEELGLDIDIDKWVITEVARCLPSGNSNVTSGTLSINISAAHLCHHDLSIR